MARGTDESREDRDERLAAAATVEVWAAYLEAVARWDQCVSAYVTLCLYVLTPPVRDSDWQFELTSSQFEL
jgi:hypothetical protein